MPSPIAANRDPANDPALCGYYGQRTKRTGELCQGVVIADTKRCRMHAGKKAAQAKAEVEITKEYRRLLGMNDLPQVQPRSQILHLVSVTSYLMKVYGAELWKAIDEADGDTDKALTGDSYSVNAESGIATKVGEYHRMLYKRFHDIVDQNARMCDLAIKAKATEELVEMHKQLGDTSARLVLNVARDLGIPVDDENVQRLMVTHLQRLAPSAMMIEGSLAA